MAIKVGNSWVSEAAYAYASQKAEKPDADSGMLQTLSEKFSDSKLTTNTAPFQGKGVNNIAIAPNILRQMENDPEKRLEYEALIYDCASLQKSLAGKTVKNGGNLIGQGFIIDSNGGLGSWSISRSSGGKSRTHCLLPKNDKNSWMDKMFSGLNTPKPAAIYDRLKS